MDAREEGPRPQEEAEGICEQSFPTTLDIVGEYTVMDAYSAVTPDAGASVTLVCFNDRVAAILFRTNGGLR